MKLVMKENNNMLVAVRVYVEHTTYESLKWTTVLQRFNITRTNERQNKKSGNEEMIFFPINDHFTLTGFS